MLIEIPGLLSAEEVAVAVATLLAGAALLAVWVPARRAAVAEPMRVLERN